MGAGPTTAAALLDVLHVSREHAHDAGRWREIAQAAIHQLAAQRLELRRLHERHDRLVDEYRRLRQFEMRGVA